MSDCAFKWIGGLLLMIAGCTALPQQLYVSELEQGFAEGAIIAARSGHAIEFNQLVDELAGAAMVFIGEIHSSPAHHAVQLKILRALHQQRPQLTVGMEMFDRSYQPVLDLWRRGRLAEEDFIKQTHWYANWRYDFSLYREILQFLKAHSIDLIGLDIPTYIPGRIRVGGLESLSSTDRDWLPDQIPPGNDDHRLFLERTFQQHRFIAHTTTFEDFYAAQCARDAAMARTIADHLGTGSIVVLAGNGHIRSGYGVPRRAHDYSGATYRTVYLASVGETIALDIADFIWVTPGPAHPSRGRR